MEQIRLFEQKKDCCACGACMNACPKGAITMREDEKGFLYPEITHESCIRCHACQQVCAYQNAAAEHHPLKCYAAAARDPALLKRSSSGGIFASLARAVLAKGGVVFGAALDVKDGHALAHHIGITEEGALGRLQGSKYVQSLVGDTYRQARQALQEGRQVLFSGTPCQVAGLYGFLRKDYEGLLTVDLICHGVPGLRMFDDYLQHEARKQNATKATGYLFREKSKGWGMMKARLELEMPDQTRKIRQTPARLDSYYTLFLDGVTYRENCYSCKYACEHRPGDLTLGDYWGIAREHPEWETDGRGPVKDGISCVIANTEKGLQRLEGLAEAVSLLGSTFDKIARQNGQLRQASKAPANREEVLALYRPGEYGPVDRYFREHYRKQRIVHGVYNSLPMGLRVQAKKLLRK